MDKKILELFNSDKKGIEIEFEKLDSEYYVTIDEQPITIKIIELGSGIYGYRLSHFCKGANRQGGYNSSINDRFDSVYEALRNAQRTLLLHYNPEAGTVEWVPNPHFM